MTQEEIIKGNKLIAEFMGAVIIAEFNGALGGYPDTKLFDFIHKELYPDNYKRYHSSLMLQYHSSWDWLMSVIERIKYVEDNQEEFFGEEYFNIHFEIDLLNGVDLRIDKVRIFMQTAFGKGQLIESVYGGVLAFIKWYNNIQNEKTVCNI